jgi:hypothetical protein
MKELIKKTNNFLVNYLIFSSFWKLWLTYQNLVIDCLRTMAENPKNILDQ